MKKIWLCTIAKMEELYIREWIEYHKNIGIDHIVIGDNNTPDYKNPLQPIIQDYIDEGFVEIIDAQKSHKPNRFFTKIYNTNKSNFDWIGFIDVDEFIEIPAYNNIHLFFDNEQLNSFNSVVLSGLRHTDNGHVYFEDKPVRERFTNTASEETEGIKYFLKSLDKLLIINTIHNPKKIKRIGNCCDVLFNSIDDTYDNTIGVKRDDNKIYTNIYTQNAYYNVIYFSHYHTKSTEEYIKYKILRGRSNGNTTARYNKKNYYTINEVTEEKEQLFAQYEITE
jgi:hypothetical protein